MAAQGHGHGQGNGQGRFGRTQCSNCGEYGHTVRSCSEPVTSYGVIAFRVHDASWNPMAALAAVESTEQPIPLDKIQFLMIQRRDSIGYIEIIRSKYKLTDTVFIRQQIEGTTAKEREKLLTWAFDDLWTGLWGPMNSSENRQYKQEYESAKVRFELFRKGVKRDDGSVVRLADCLAEVPLLWDTPEWGFPKGRRNLHETDFQCAMREFEEETNLSHNCLHILENTDRIVETFVGNNNIRYRHIYYVTSISNEVVCASTTKNTHMAREVGALAWLSYEDAIQRIRPTTPQKRDVLHRVWALLRDTCPLWIGFG
jgi:8-oxo-dGTP pyrophosphatase MutT (NUDIX family)